MVTTCIIPCAGLGTRLRPLTRVVAKELLPYGDRPMIEHLWEEVWAAGCRRVIIVLRPGKEMVRQHLEAAGLPAIYVEQSQPNGLADALRAAAPLVEGPALVALPDQQLARASSNLLAAYRAQHTLFSQVRVDHPEFFPGATAFRTDADNNVLGLAGEHGLWRGFGRTVYAPEFFHGLPPDSRDGDFFSIISQWLSQGTHQVVSLPGQAADLGILSGYLHYNRQQG